MLYGKQVSLLVRLIRLLLAMSVGAQAWVQGTSVLVCRSTGEIVHPCGCPHEHAEVADRTTIKDQGCCELRSMPPAIPATHNAAPPILTKQVLVPWAMREPALPIAKPGPPLRLAARQQAPPSTPLYLSIRVLRI
jgi:hypothetical protein